MTMRPNLLEPGAVLGTIKTKPLRGGLPARLDSPCARRLWVSAWPAGARKGASKPNKEMDKGHAHAYLTTFPAEVCEGVNNAMEDRSSRRNRELGIRTARLEAFPLIRSDAR
jgi:hypothetical protein